MSRRADGSRTLSPATLTGAVALALAAAAAQAQEAGRALEEVVVTAQKRESTIQDTPIAMTAFTGDDLAAVGVTGTEQLANFTPGLTVQKEVIGKVVIRGVGTENYTVGSDPGVAIHKDGVYVARSSVAIFDFFDVSRVEVLRGPQGTLYGRNATGGVINIISNEPTDEFGGYVTLDVGDYNKRRVEGAINGAFGDNVAARLSVLYAERDGYTDNIYPGRDAVPPNAGNSFGVPAISSAGARDVDQLDNQDLLAFRGQLKFDLGDSASLLFGAEIIQDDSLPPAFKYFDTSDAYWFNVVGPDQDIPDLRTVSQGFEQVIPGYDREVPSVGNADQDSFWMNIDWDLGFATLNSLTGYREIDFSWINDGDGFDTYFVNYFQTDESTQWTQEFQLTSNASGPWQWIVGAFYLDEEAETFTGIPFLAFANPGAPYIIWDGASNTQAWAIFGQVTYSFTDRLRTTVGLRYNEEDKDGFLEYDLFGLGAFPRQDLEDSWDSFTPKFALEYDFTDDMMGYVSATRGFKSGGFNLIAFQDPYEPEYLWAYEVGLKTRSSDGRWVANFGAFYYDYEDMQVGKVVNLSATVANAAAATIQGLEAEVKAALGAGFEVDAAISWLDAKYDEFITEDPGYPGAVGCGTYVSGDRTLDLADCELPRAPEFQGILGLTWSTVLSGGGEFRIRGDYSYRGDQYFTQFNRDVVSQDAYDIINARVTYTGANARWSVTAYGSNLTDEDYFVTVLESGVAAPGTVVPQAVLGAPRTYGVVLNYNF